MNEKQLLDTLREYGADTEAILDRFLGDLSFYGSCLSEFFTECPLSALDEAMKKRDGTAAFEAAHALKGTSGNMGLTPLYTPVCTLVELLRAGKIDGAGDAYNAVKIAYDRARMLAH